MPLKKKSTGKDTYYYYENEDKQKKQFTKPFKERLKDCLKVDLIIIVSLVLIGGIAYFIGEIRNKEDTQEAIVQNPIVSETNEEDEWDEEAYKKELAQEGRLPVEGLSPWDITGNNESYIEKPEEQKGQIGDEWVSIWESAPSAYGDTGALIYYYVMGDPIDTIIATFTIENSGLAEEEYFKSWAKDFLGFNATIPYDTATPKEAREWVESTIDTLEEGQTYEKIFGDAKYEVYGKPDYMIVLNITADKSKYIE